MGTAECRHGFVTLLVRGESPGESAGQRSSCGGRGYTEKVPGLFDEGQQFDPREVHPLVRVALESVAQGAGRCADASRRLIVSWHSVMHPVRPGPVPDARRSVGPA